MTHVIGQKKKVWQWIRIVCAVFVGTLLLLMILPSTGCIYNPADNQFYKGMWHAGSYIFYPAALFYIVYMPLAVGFVIFGIIRHYKFEIAGWIMLAFIVFTMVLDS